MEPTGATKVQRAVLPLASCQNAAKLCGGAEQETIAGVATDTEVSLNSRLGELLEPIHSTEQVALTP